MARITAQNLAKSIIVFFVLYLILLYVLKLNDTISFIVSALATILVGLYNGWI